MIYQKVGTLQHAAYNPCMVHLPTSGFIFMVNVGKHTSPMDAMGAAIGEFQPGAAKSTGFSTVAPGRPLSVRLSNSDLGNLRVEVSNGGGCLLGSLKFIFGRKTKSKKNSKEIYSYMFGLKMVPSKLFREVSKFLTTRNEKAFQANKKTCFR